MQQYGAARAQGVGVEQRAVISMKGDGKKPSAWKMALVGVFLDENGLTGVKLSRSRVGRALAMGVPLLVYESALWSEVRKMSVPDIVAKYPEHFFVPRGGANWVRLHRGLGGTVLEIFLNSGHVFDFMLGMTKSEYEQALSWLNYLFPGRVVCH